MITQEEITIQAKISAIQKACQQAHEELERLLEPLREPLGEYSRQLKALQTARFEQETGLKIGDELYPTFEFMRSQQQMGNVWDNNKPLTVGDISVFEYVNRAEIVVSQDGLQAGGVPVILALHMRHEWLNRYSPVKP